MVSSLMLAKINYRLNEIFPPSEEVKKLESVCLLILRKKNSRNIF